jgi:hypothetical protein
MPKIDIDYSNTIIYKIGCKDKAVTDVYVGHTTNFVQRKHAHKLYCKSPNQTDKLYEVIRANGGWENWKMEIINYFNCANHYEARKKEQDYIRELKANLNAIEPLPQSKQVSATENIIITKPSLHCSICNINCNSHKLFEKHNKTTKHIMSVKMVAKSCENNEKKYNCANCHYSTSRKSSHDKHLLTAKHLFRTNSMVIEQPSCAENSLICKICKKTYKARNSLWYHEQKCKGVMPLAETPNPVAVPVPSPDEFKSLSNLVVELIKSNTDLQKQMLEVCKNNTTTNINNNSHNKTFNMQVFLNEKCKDAMNIMDFVNTMTLELSDLEDVGEMGYVEGISKIIIRKLNELDVYKRPIHCSDFKREIMYVKDMDIWSKENSTFDKIRKAIKYVTKKNGDLLIPWIQKYPLAMNIQHPYNDIYMRIMNQAMGGRESFVESENKIIKKISKAVQIDKSVYKSG